MAKQTPSPGESYGTHVGKWSANDDELYTLYILLGIAVSAVNFGAFSGSILSDNEELKTLLQQLETAIESVTTLNPYSKIMTGNEVFTAPATAERKYFLDPNGALRNFDPSGVFPAGFQATVLNVGGSYNIVFDSAVSAQTLTPGGIGTFIYDGTKWW